MCFFKKYIFSLNVNTLKLFTKQITKSLLEIVILFIYNILLVLLKYRLIITNFFESCLHVKDSSHNNLHKSCFFNFLPLLCLLMKQQKTYSL